MGCSSHMSHRRRALWVGIAAVLVLVSAGIYVGQSRRTSIQTAGTVIVAAGDIACDPAYPNFNEGGGTAVGCHQKATSDLVAQIAPKAVLALGDIQYVHGTPSNYAASYDPTWGRFKNITYPVLGNHEGGEGGTNTAYFNYFGQNAGDRAKGYYSLDIEDWHVVALNSNCGAYRFNGSYDGCREGSAQEQWLKADLAAHPAQCVLAYFHVPRFSSGSDHHSDAGSDAALGPIWQDLYAAGVDIILNGHSHEYERFAPLDPAGRVDEARGIREFIVGTGGDDHHKPAGPVVGSEVRNSDSFGVLKLVLRSDSYDWQFVNDGSPGSINNDKGSGSCHR